MELIKYFLLIILISLSAITLKAQVYKTSKASVYFKSDAPLEVIEAKSKNLKGAIDASNRTFAFSIPINTFLGFNSPLQREHFNENYLESKKYSNGTFTGKIIEKIDFTKDGKHLVRAKGKLTIHGVTQERIIKSHLEIRRGKIYIETNFTVLLDEHKIRVPKIVYQKISKEIFVEVNAIFDN